MTHVLNKGTQITCPRKGHAIGTLNRELISGGIVGLGIIDFEPGQERIAGERAICKLCGSMYFLQGMIHTIDGWSPNDPVLETPPMR